MPVVEGELETRTEDPAACPDLVGFSCGDKRYPHEATVERIVEDLRLGSPSHVSLRVTRELPAGTLVGLSIIVWKNGPLVRHRLISDEEYRDAVYIAVLTLAEPYRGRFTCRDGTALSDYLMAETLQFIEDHEGTMPIVQVLIEEDNDDSRELAVRHRFEQPLVTSPDLLYVRRPVLDWDEPDDVSSR